MPCAGTCSQGLSLIGGGSGADKKKKEKKLTLVGVVDGKVFFSGLLTDAEDKLVTARPMFGILPHGKAIDLYLHLSGSIFDPKESVKVDSVRFPARTEEGRKVRFGGLSNKSNALAVHREAGYAQLAFSLKRCNHEAARRAVQERPK
jgi:hypothetical protein